MITTLKVIFLCLFFLFVFLFLFFLKARFCCKALPIHILLEALTAFCMESLVINPRGMVMEDMRKSLSIKSVFLIVFN